MPNCPTLIWWTDDARTVVRDRSHAEASDAHSLTSGLQLSNSKQPEPVLSFILLRNKIKSTEKRGKKKKWNETQQDIKVGLSSVSHLKAKYFEGIFNIVLIRKCNWNIVYRSFRIKNKFFLAVETCFLKFKL